MEHGKFSVSKIWHIAKMEYIKLIMDPRMILAARLADILATIRSGRVVESP